MDFEKIVMMFTMQEPFYGILLSAMERTPTEKIPTLGVTRSGNVFRLYYNPNFIKGLPTDTVLELLRHEVLHVAFNHFTIWDGEDVGDTSEMHALRNVAEDLEINGYLNRAKMDSSIGGMWPEDFGWRKYEGTREYFRKLMHEKEEQEQKEQQSQQRQGEDSEGQGLGEQPSDCSGEDQNDDGGGSDEQQEIQSEQPAQQTQQSGGDRGTKKEEQKTQPSYAEKLSANRFDDHSMWPDDVEDAETLQQIVDDLLVMAADEVEKSRGTVPGEMRVRIDAIRAKKPRPVTDWKRYFRRYLGNEFSEMIRKSKKRESRRFPDAAGNRHRRKSHILVAVDTSGSVSMPEYNEFFSQIRTLSDTATFHVLECDSRIVHEYDFRGICPQTLHGGGGTDFQPVIDYFNKNRKLYDALVYFTDGGAPIPKDTPKDTLWVISSLGDKDRARYKVNGASVVFIKANQ